MSSAVVDPHTTKVLPDAAAIEEWLINTLAEQLNLSADEIELDEPFASFGLGSADAVMLSGDLQDWLARELSPTLFWEYPTITSLAAYLARA